MPNSLLGVSFPRWGSWIVCEGRKLTESKRGCVSTHSWWVAWIPALTSLKRQTPSLSSVAFSQGVCKSQRTWTGERPSELRLWTLGAWWHSILEGYETFETQGWVEKIWSLISLKIGLPSSESGPENTVCGSTQMELTLPLCLPVMMDTSARHFLTGSNYHNMSIQTLIDPTHSSYEKPQLLWVQKKKFHLQKWYKCLPGYPNTNSFD